MDTEASKKNAQQLQNQIDLLKKQLEDEKQKANLVQSQNISEEAKKFSQLYEAMDSSASAKIFEQMGESKMDLIISIIKNIKKEKTSEILAAMKPEFASKLTEKMSQLYIPTKK
jgi:flagellar motility protein MotE (MotC chaperone)